jgi:predicted HAD superfamily Cof-like phosphohydrolase
MSHVIEDVFMEIQASNMSKLGVDGKPIYREDGKVMKGEQYFKPRIAEVLREREANFAKA